MEHVSRTVPHTPVTRPDAEHRSRTRGQHALRMTAAGQDWSLPATGDPVG
ncbi:MAG TPA: hypothetical protein VNO31_25705 [Umezawaea sp.]|nr:hypothetical protein [Umezawaea sp.]